MLSARESLNASNTQENLSVKIKIGTRGSQLALAQTEIVRRALASRPNAPEIEVCQISTRGDQRQGTADAQIPDKKKWVIDIEQAVLREEVDFAVHSGKDLPNDIEAGTMMWPLLERQYAEDVFIGARKGDKGERIGFDEVPQGAAVGTASARRAAQLRRLRPDLIVVEHRGNVPTRLKKLDETTELSGIVLARAGLERLGLADHVSTVFTAQQIVPALNQGMLVVQFRENDERIAELLEDLIAIRTLAEWQAERAAVALLGADCHSAVGIFASSDGAQVSLLCRVLSGDGSKAVESSSSGSVAMAEEIGERAAKELLEKGAGNLIESCGA